MQRPGPVTSAERNTPVGRSAFVHWAPKNEPSSAKEADSKTDIGKDGRQMEATQDASAVKGEIERTGKAATDEKAVDPKLEGSTSASTALDNVNSTEHAPVTKANANSPIDEGHEGGDVDGDEAAVIEMLDSDDGPRKRRKVTRGRGRGRR